MEYSAFIFDFDGVIADSVEVKTGAFAKLFSQYGSETEKKVVDHHRSHGGMTRVEKFKYYYREFLDRDITKKELKDLCHDFSLLVVDEVVASPGISGAYEFLEKWHEKVMCFVDSATPDNEIVEIVKRRGLDHFFHEVLGSGNSKSDNLKNILLKYRLDHQKCIFWGDAHSDYLAARECRVNFIGIVPNQSAPLLKKEPEIKWYKDFITMQNDKNALII